MTIPLKSGWSMIDLKSDWSMTDLKSGWGIADVEECFEAVVQEGVGDLYSEEW